MKMVYGARCAWFDTIDKAALHPNGVTPCCPFCQSVLYEQDEAAWWAAVKRHAKKVPGYEAVVRWSQGRCFASWQAAKAAYEAERSAP